MLFALQEGGGQEDQTENAVLSAVLYAVVKRFSPTFPLGLDEPEYTLLGASFRLFEALGSSRKALSLVWLGIN